MAGINLSSSTSGGEKSVRSSGSFDKSFVFFTVLFLLTALLFGGTRYYIKTLDAKRVALDVKLAESSAQLQGKAVDRVASFDKRLTLVGEQLRDRSVDSQKLLSQLENLTVPNVKLKKYEYSEAEKYVMVEGETENFKYIAQQIISFKSDALFSGITVESLTRTKEGRIAFSLKAEFN